jgi:hypothetical protein
MVAAAEHTQTICRWLKQVVLDPRVKDFTVRVAAFIFDHVNRKSGDAHPSQELIADRLGRTRRGVQKALSELRDEGHLEITLSGGKRLGR